MFKNSIVFLLLFLLIPFLIVAQEGRKKVPLKNILNAISKQHDVRFSYIEDEIVLYTLESPETNLTLTQKIEYLKKTTQLEFKTNSEKYYSIFNNQKLDKPLCGFLIDATTGNGIENAVITLENTAISVFSDASGRFELPKISSNSLIVTHQGYEYYKINSADVNVSDCPKFYLSSIIQSLEEVVKQRYLTTGISKKNDGSILIKPKKFGILPGLIEPDVMQTMQQVPGIMSVDETISNINVRGGTHDQNLFLWNGIRMFQTGHFFGLISAFNPSLAQTISITKNGTSAFFGESVSSLVAISSQTNAIEKNSNSVSTNLISAEFYSKLKISPTANLTISGRRSLTDFFNSPTYKNYSNRIFQNTVITNLATNEIVDYESEVDFYFYDVTAQYQQKIGKKHELNIDVIAIENDLDFRQTLANTNKNSSLKQSNLGANLLWKTNWSSNSSTSFSGYVSSYRLLSKNERLENNQILNQKNQVLDSGFQLKHSQKLNQEITLNSGYQFNEIGVTNFDNINLPLFSRTITNVLLTHVAIAEGIYESENKKTLLNLGIRSHYFDKFNTILVEPRIQFNQAITTDLSLVILGEQKNQTLSQIIDLQQDFLGIEKRRWTLANNTTIPIQKSNQFSLGFNYKKNNWLITLDNFYKKITGITSSSQGFQNQFELQKAIGDYTILGTELLVQKSINHFSSWISYTYNNNKYDFNTFSTTPFPNNFDITHTISWAGIYEWHKLKLALGAKWHSGRPFTTPAQLFITETNPSIVYNSPNNSRLNDYLQVNFSASKEWTIHQKMTLQTSLSILNILNRRNSLNRFYVVDQTNNSVESVDTYSLELTPNFMMKLSF